MTGPGTVAGSVETAAGLRRERTGAAGAGAPGGRPAQVAGASAAGRTSTAASTVAPSTVLPSGAPSASIASDERIRPSLPLLHPAAIKTPIVRIGTTGARRILRAIAAIILRYSPAARCA